jgi:hypothetical protein
LRGESLERREERGERRTTIPHGITHYSLLSQLSSLLSPLSTLLSPL